MSIISIVHEMNQTISAELRKLDSPLTDTQIITLNAISRGDGVSQTDLTIDTGIDRSTMADVVKRLLSKKLVTRCRRKDDARAYVIRISSDGMDVLAKSNTARRKAEKALTEKYPVLRQIAAE